MTTLRGYALLTLLLLALAGAPAAAQAAPSGERCFPETGHCIGGPIRAYWERGGGLAVFGYPIGPQREELVEGRSLIAQWFERDRLEIQLDGALTAGRLGARFLELQGRPWFSGEQRAPAPGCRAFPQTGYQICGKFLAYWERRGGLERFGYPITAPAEELVEGRSYTVQYFERRRMELHPELAGTPYEIQLGLLGREIATAAVCPAAPSEALQRAVRAYLAQMGCPIAAGRASLPIAWQRYERGAMYWVAATSSAPPMIFIVISDDAAQRATWLARTDTYQPGERVGEAAPSWRIAPANGFGKIWWSDASIQAALGWPIEAEQSGVGSAVAFATGGWMFDQAPRGLVIVMQPDGSAFGVRTSILPR